MNVGSIDTLADNLYSSYLKTGGWDDSFVSVEEEGDYPLAIRFKSGNITDTDQLKRVSECLMVAFQDNQQAIEGFYKKLIENCKSPNSKIKIQLLSAKEEAFAAIELLDKVKQIVKITIKESDILGNEEEKKKLQSIAEFLQRPFSLSELHRITRNLNYVHEKILTGLFEKANAAEKLQYFPDAMNVLLLQSNCEELACSSKAKRNPLHYAASLSDMNALEKIKNLGKENISNWVNIPSKVGYTPLHYALAKNNFAFAEELIRLGADINAVDNRGESVLHHAARFNMIEPLQWCLKQKNLNVNAVNVFGQTAMHLVQDKQGKAAKLLLSNEDVANNLSADIFGNLPTTPPPPSIEQEIVLNKLIDYLKLKGRDVSVLPDGGHCNGLAFLAQYYHDQGKEDEFYRTLSFFSKWDGKLDNPEHLKFLETVSGKYEKVEDLFEQWINDIVWFQYTYLVLNGSHDIKGGSQKERKLQLETVSKKTQITPRFRSLSLTATNLTRARLTEMLNYFSVFPGTVIDFGGGEHATSAYVNPNGKLSYYDPNFPEKVPPCISDEVSRLIEQTKYRAMDLHYESMEMVLSTYVYGKDKPKLQDKVQELYDSPSANGFSLYHKAILLNEPSRLPNNGDVNLPDDFGRTPLQFAIMLDRSEILENLLSRKELDLSGALRDAMEYKNLKAFKRLLQVCNDAPKELLDFATRSGNTLFINELLKSGKVSANQIDGQITDH